jgi:hypothetical protein
MPYTLTKARGGVVAPFPLKLHYILSQEEVSGIISWQPHGRSFKLHNPEKFLEQVMPLHFEQTMLSSFRRQLNLYGFRRFLSGRDKGGYYHELFIRGQPELCSQIIRTTVKGRTKVKVAEPNFYKMPSSQAEQFAAEQKVVFRPVSPSLSDDDLDFVSSSDTDSHSALEGQQFESIDIPTNQIAFARTCTGNYPDPLTISSEENTLFDQQPFTSFETIYNPRLSSFGVTEFEGKEFQTLDHITYKTLQSHFNRRFSTF